MAQANWTTSAAAGAPSISRSTATLIGRLLLGGPFFIGGTQKLMALQNFANGLARNGIPDSITPFLAPIAATVEAGGGLLVMIGLATTWAALLMILFTIIATLTSHRFWQFEGAVRQAQSVNFSKNLMIIGGFCFLWVIGAGKYSLDSRFKKRS
ncbi:MAG: DoxX family protein [Xanthobacteraceae bacterium]